MSLSRQEEITSWNQALNNFIVSDFILPEAMKRFPTRTFTKNVDFVKSWLLYDMQLIYFSKNVNTVKDNVVTRFLKVFLAHPTLQAYASDAAFQAYFKKLLDKLVNQSDEFAEPYIKFVLYEQLKERFIFSYHDQKITVAAIKSYCENAAKVCGLKKITFAENRISLIAKWLIVKIPNKVAIPNVVDLSITDQCFIAAFTGIGVGLGLHVFLESAIGLPIVSLSSVLGAISFVLIVKEEVRSTSATFDSFTKKAGELLKIKITEYKYRRTTNFSANEINFIFEGRVPEINITPTESVTNKPTSSYEYLKKLLPTILTSNENEIKSQPNDKDKIPNPKVIEGHKHVRFNLNNVTYDAYLNLSKLPADKIEQEAFVKAFEKGYATSSEGKQPRAIVSAQKPRYSCPFKVKIEGNGRMLMTHPEPVRLGRDDHKEICFDFYDPNSHRNRFTVIPYPNESIPEAKTQFRA